MPPLRSNCLREPMAAAIGALVTSSDAVLPRAKQGSSQAPLNVAA